MMGYLEDLERIALTALFNPVFLFLLIVLFLAGKYLGKITKRLSWWKILLIAYIGLFLYAPVRDAGPIIGGVFLLGIASNHVGTLFSVLGWASSLGDVIWALRYKSAYADIRLKEQELEERERKFREAELRQAYQQQEKGQRARSGWQQEAKGFRNKPQGAQTTREKADDKQSRSRYKFSNARGFAKEQIRPAEDKKARCLKILGLDPSRSYNPDELKAAYRKKVKKIHPDAGGSQVEFIEVVNAYECLLS